LRQQSPRTETYRRRRKNKLLLLESNGGEFMNLIASEHDFDLWNATWISVRRKDETRSSINCYVHLKAR
jgi:hypothetical protein